LLALDIDARQYPGVPKVVASACAPVLQRRLGERDAVSLASALRALADPARLRLLSFLADQPDGEACVCHLTETAGLAQPTVSHHMRRLMDAGLVARDKRGAWVYYRLVDERLEALRTALAPRTTGRRGHRA
jgi:ArsR family transcriptional regulator